MRRSSTLAAVSLVVMALGAPAVAGNPQVKPGTVVKVAPSDRRGPIIDNESKVFLQSHTLGSGAAAGKEEVYYKITIQEGRSAADPKRSFEIKDWSFEGPSKVDSFTVKQGVKPVGTSDLTMRGTSPAEGLGLGKDLQAQDKMGNAPLDRPTFGQKFSMNGEPQSPGTLRVKVRFPWLGCEEGKSYPAATMEGGGKTYQLTDVTIRGCSASGPTEEITFVYGQMVVR